MPTQDDITAQLKLLQTHRQILQIALFQLAGLSPLYAPPGVIKSVDDARAEIRQIKQSLRAWGEHVDDHPNDEPPDQAGQPADPYLQLHDALLLLDYQTQDAWFGKYLDSSRIAAFLIHGDSPEYGQRWLLNRLLRQRISTTDKVLRVDLYRKTRGSDLSSLWREMAQRVGLGSSQPIPAIAERVGGWLKTQSVVLIFDNAEALLQGGLTTFVEEFWRPLVAIAQAAPAAGPQRLLMFLLDNDGAGAACSAPLAEIKDPAWQPHQPVKLPAIRRFSTPLLAGWIATVGTRLPQPFPNLLTEDQDAIDRAADTIVEQSQQGLPLEAMIAICEQCECHWYEKEAVWLKY